MREVFKGIKKSFSNYFSDYRYSEVKGRKGKESCETHELARMIQEQLPKTRKAKKQKARNNKAGKKFNATFLRAFGFKTPIIYTNKVTVNSAIRSRVSKIWKENEETFAIKKKPTRKQVAMMEYLKKSSEKANDIYAERLEIRFVSDEMGYGVFAAEDIPRGSVIGQYAGELIEFEGAQDNGYLFSFPDSPFEDFVINPQERGNYMQFLNHASVDSRANNIEVTEFFYDKRPRIFMITDRRVKKGEQLLYDYGDDYWKDMGCKPVKV